jgi:2-amino-4-hydroxy-6-hydroxymethyldihydropteridine diphosphokinase
MTAPVVNGAFALGSNVTSSAGNPVETLRSALFRLSQGPLSLTGISRFYRTPAWPPGSGDDYVNAAATFTAVLSPAGILGHLHAVEAEHGRHRAGRWMARTLDLDLLYCDDRVHPDAASLRAWIDLPPERQRRETPDGLILPHPRLQDRAFVLIPLAEIAPAWRHPMTGETVAAMAAARPAAEKQDIQPL